MAMEITVSCECSARFAVPARYALTMLGMICGFRPRFVREAAQLHYGPAPRENAAWLPSAPGAHERLHTQGPAQPAPVDRSAFDLPFLSLFPATGDSPIASDLVSAAFFFLSLHEQWSSSARDQFDRFPSSASLLGGRGELQRPVLAEYAAVLRALLETAGHRDFPSVRYGTHTAAAVMTHDIDYLSKFTPGLLFRELVKNFLFNRRGVTPAERMRRVKEYLRFAREEQDPYVQSIRRMLAVEQEHGIRGSWLFKAGGRDKRDVTYRPESARARRVLAQLQAAGHDIGLHPSFHAHTDAAMMRGERERLRSVAGQELRSVRQHYLRFVYPHTWRLQSAEGFFVDSTLGFAEEEGFRNGSCHPFLPWDLETHGVVPLWELPLTVMDGTLAHYRGLSPDDSLRHIDRMLDTVAGAGGAAVLLFHNTAYDAHDFPGWGDVFEHSAAAMADGRFFTGTLPETVEQWVKTAGYRGNEEVIKVINSEPA